MRWAANASAALAELEKDGIDIVFSDVVMPGKMDGIGLAKTIREKNVKIPILLVQDTALPQKRSARSFRFCASPTGFMS